MKLYAHTHTHHIIGASETYMTIEINLMSLSQGLQKLRVAVLSTLLGARTEKSTNIVKRKTHFRS